MTQTPKVRPLPSLDPGQPFPAPDLLPTPADPKKPGVRVIVAWASWRPDSPLEA